MVAHRCCKDSGVKSRAFNSSVIYDNITCIAMLAESSGLCPYLVAKRWLGKWTLTAGMLTEWVSQSEECHQVTGD